MSAYYFQSRMILKAKNGFQCVQLRQISSERGSDILFNKSSVSRYTTRDFDADTLHVKHILILQEMPRVLLYKSKKR